MPISATKLDHLESKLEEALDSPTGYLLIPGTLSYSDYLQKNLTNLVRKSAIESTRLYEPTSPHYGRSLYETLEFFPTDAGLVIKRSEFPTPDPALLLITVAFTGKSYHQTLNSPAEAKKVAKRVTRIRDRLLNYKDFLTAEENDRLRLTAIRADAEGTLHILSTDLHSAPITHDQAASMIHETVKRLGEVVDTDDDTD